MRTHPGERIRVSQSNPIRHGKDGKPVVVIGLYFRTTAATAEPDGYISLEDAQRRKRENTGCFINRKRAFRTNESKPLEISEERRTKSFHCTDSQMIDEPVMTRFVAGDKAAIAAVNAWA